MDRLWPSDDAHRVTESRQLEASYAYPEPLERPWLRVNFVSSLDGAVAVHGSSRGLSGPDDRWMLSLIRDLSDVVLVGAGTAVAEGYRGLRHTEARSKRRARLGLSPVPPLALVSGRCSIDPDSPLLTDTLRAPIVLTCEAAPEPRRRALADAGADVVVTGTGEVDLQAALDALDARGLRRVACEGGPTLFGELLRADLVDELCLTVSPLLAGGAAGRIAAGPAADQPRRLHLSSVLHAEDTLLLRYQRAEAESVAEQRSA